jgi:hypothetical protein
MAVPTGDPMDLDIVKQAEHELRRLPQPLFLLRRPKPRVSAKESFKPPSSYPRYL